jgi:hypothetical protein
MSINENWDRWIVSSLSDYFGSVAETISFPIFIEGQNRPMDVNDFSEIRFDGPHWNELSKGLWRLDVVVAIMVNLVQSDDVYRINRIIGSFSSMFKSTLQTYKYGDSDSEFLCLNLDPARNEKIRVDKFGMTKAATPVVQASVEARYYGMIIQ